MKKILSFIAFLGLATTCQAQSLSTNTLEVCFETEKAADSIISKNPDLHFRRVIPRATNPVIEERHRRAGLDLWYVGEVDTKDKVTEQVKRFKAMPHVRKAMPTEFREYENIPVTPDDKTVDVSPRKTSARRTSEATAVNDPLYNMQWHYANSDYANINLEKAWAVEPGKRNVVVAVIDGMIDYTHPDLAQNMWVNEAEKNGLPGVDDDGNGYVDDIYGVDLFGQEGFADHGTHIAGTIAAVNNNGIGVCGIAGGDGVNTGVRVMSIAITSPSGRSFVPTWLQAQAFVYAADNGAVIASNSWGADEMPSEIRREGIKYFMEYAGSYEGSPMKGGLVVFGAGNDHKNTPDSPINDSELTGDNFITVGGTASNGLRSSFSNYGPWVDITAPAGDWNGRGIYSTFPDGKYGFMNGTSMATPHVSAVAALVVSKFASPTLTPGWVKHKLQNSASPIDPRQAGYEFVGQMGAGLLDAYRAVCAPAEAPKTPTDFNVIRDIHGSSLFSWTVPADADGNPVSKCVIYPDNSKIPLAKVQTIGTPVGDTYYYFCKEHESGTSSQSYRIKSMDVMGNESEFSTPVQVQEPTEPIFVNPHHTSNFVVYRPFALNNNPIKLTCNPKFKLMEPDAMHMAHVKVTDPNNIVTATYFSNEISVNIKANEDTPTGRFPFTLSCYYGDSPEKKYTLELSYTVEDSLRNIRGIVAIDKEKMDYYTSEKIGTLEINLRDYVQDANGLDFVILDDEEDEIDFFGYRYTISNDILKTEYNFTKRTVQEPVVTIPIRVYNTYFIQTSIDFFIHYREATGIKDAITDNGPTPSAIYTPTGMKLSGNKSHLAPGMYIIDGRKVIIH